MTALVSHLLVVERQEDYGLVNLSKKLVPLEQFFQHGVQLLIELPDASEILFMLIFHLCDKSVELW